MEESFKIVTGSKDIGLFCFPADLRRDHDLPVYKRTGRDWTNRSIQWIFDDADF